MSDPKQDLKNGSTRPGAERTFSSRDLFGGERQIWIVHEKQRYRLLITRAGKLILNK